MKKKVMWTNDQNFVCSHAEVLQLLVTTKTLPDDFDQWNLPIDNKLGLTIAHAAAYFNCLPSNFDQWELADKDGLTVAHYAAFWGHLPLDFNQWDIADESGWTVAHVAALFGHLPLDFNQWDISDNNGVTVLDAYKSFKIKIEGIFSRNKDKRVIYYSKQK